MIPFLGGKHASWMQKMYLRKLALKLGWYAYLYSSHIFESGGSNIILSVIILHGGTSSVYIGCTDLSAMLLKLSYKGFPGNGGNECSIPLTSVKETIMHVLYTVHYSDILP